MPNGGYVRVVSKRTLSVGNGEGQPVDANPLFPASALAACRITCACRRALSSLLPDRPRPRVCWRGAASGATERHYAAPVSTDSGQRRFSTQFSTPKSQRNGVEGLYLLVTATSWGGRPEFVTSLPSWSCGFDSRRPLFACGQCASRLGGRWMARWRSISPDIPPTVP